MSFLRILSEFMSKDHYQILEKLSRPMRDEELAAELNLKETIVRTLLNDLHAKGLVEYEKNRDEGTGWYTYVWKRREDKIEEYVRRYLEEKLQRLQQQLELERSTPTFACSCSRVPLEKAMSHDFICPNCNRVFVEFDNSELIKIIESEIERIEKLLKR